MRLKTLGVLAAAVAGVAFSAAGAMANTIYANDASAASGGSGQLITYNIYLSNDAEFTTTQSSNYVVIADYPGVTSASFVPSGNLINGWTGTATVTSAPDPQFVTAVPDNAAAPDVELSFSGGTATLSGAPSGLLLGVLTVDTTSLNSLQQTAVPNAYSVDTAISPNGEHGDTSYAMVPVPLPEAAWMGMSTLLAVAGLGLIRRRRWA